MRNKRIIAVNSNCYHGFGIEEAIEGIRKAGFHYIELTATKGWTEHVFPNQSFERLWEVKEKLKSAGLESFSMSGHCNLMDPSRKHDFINNIRLASFFNSRYIVSSVGEAHLKDMQKVSDSEAARLIGELVPDLKAFGLMLVLETHGEHGSGKILSQIVQSIGSEYVGINYDTANALFYGNVNLAQDIDLSMNFIKYVHLKDKAGLRDEWNFPALGKGWIDFPMVFDKFEKARNFCPFSIEIEFTKAGPKDLQEVNEAVAESASYLKANGYEL